MPLPVAQPPASGLLDPVADSAAWDALVARHPEATVFQTSAWAKVLADTYNYRPFYFATDRAGSPELACVFEVDSLITGRRGISLPFTDECRLLAGDELAGQKLFGSVLEYGRARRWASFELRGTNVESDAPPSLSFYAHALDLGPRSDALFAAFHSSVRRAIRKAERSGLTVQIETSFDSVRDYFQLHCLTRRKHGLPPQPFRFFAAIHRHVIGQGRGFVAVARLKNNPVAAALLLTHGRQVHYKFGASDSRYDDLRPSNLAMWQAIRHAVDRGFERLEFGRTSLHNTGLRQYKLRWGTRETKLDYRKWNYQKQAFVRDTDRSSGLKNHLFRLLPLPINRVLGQLLYPHIA